MPLNPNGLRLFSYPIETLRSTTMQNYIAEWASPNFHHAQYWPFLLIVLATFATLGWSRIPVRPRDVILLLVSLYASLASIRMIPFFVLIAVPAHLPSAWHLASDGCAIFATSSARVSILAQRCHHPRHGYLCQLPHHPGDPAPATRRGRSYSLFGAVSFLQAHPPSGPIFNHYDWGGYLIWKLYPSTPVFIDGRADLYGAHCFTILPTLINSKVRGSKSCSAGISRPSLSRRDSALATGLQSAPGWTVAYRDSQAIILYDAASRMAPSRFPPLCHRPKVEQ